MDFHDLIKRIEYRVAVEVETVESQEYWVILKTKTSKSHSADSLPILPTCIFDSVLLGSSKALRMSVDFIALKTILLNLTCRHNFGDPENT